MLQQLPGTEERKLSPPSLLINIKLLNSHRGGKAQVFPFGIVSMEELLQLSVWYECHVIRQRSG